MKTRIIQTRYWDDEFVVESGKLTKYLYIYLLSSQYINISGIFQLHDKKIMTETDLTPMELQKAKEELSVKNKVHFMNGWVYVVNAEKNNAYRNSPKNETAYTREFALVPAEILSYFDAVRENPDTTIDTSMDTTHKSEIINHKSKIINQKDINKEKSTNNDIYFEIIEHFNKTFDKETKSYSAWSRNCDHWLNQYTVADIKQAITNWRRYDWWAKKDNPSLVLLFRTENKNGPCDYIDELLNLAQARKDRRPLDPLVVATERLLGNGIR